MKIIPFSILIIGLLCILFMCGKSRVMRVPDAFRRVPKNARVAKSTVSNSETISELPIVMRETTLPIVAVFPLQHYHRRRCSYER